MLTRATQLGQAAGDPVAGLAAFNPALLIAMLLHGLITVSLITALYTRLSEAASRGDHAAVMRYHHQGLRLPSVLLVPGVVLVGVLAPYVAATLFFKNSLQETRAIALVLAGLIWLVIPMAWTYLNDRVFYAHQMTWMTFRLQCVTTSLSTVGALVAATLVPSLTAFALSLGQSLAYVVARRRSGSSCCAASTATSGCAAPACLPQARACPPWLTALALSWAIHTLLPDLGETRGVRGLVTGALVLGVAGVIQLGVTWGVAHALGVREIGAALEPLHAPAPTALTCQCLLWAHTRRSRVVGDVRARDRRGRGAAVRGVGPGTVLGGRYTVRRRLEQLHDTERWSADDTTLGRIVSMLCIAGDDHRTPALLDAARRAASVTHAVFVRILDVGSDDDVAYVVEEDLGEARTLAELVTDGGVPGDEVRRITGEVAAALESAGQRGMHHLDLKPDDVLRTPDGDVRLRGLETAAVRAGEDGAEAEDAARRDAVGVVALAYAGLTGLWPLGAGGSGLAAAPRVPGGVAAPSEIAAGVPRDLDAICRLTLNDDQGPTSPGDYARQVAPWPSRQVVGRPVTRTAPVAAPEPMWRPPGTWGMPGSRWTPPSWAADDTSDTLEQPVVPAEAGDEALAATDATPTRPRSSPSRARAPRRSSSREPRARKLTPWHRHRCCRRPCGRCCWRGWCGSQSKTAASNPP